jgi:hypothetical protein
MNVPDLRAPIVQKLPDAELAQVISNGKGGMPPAQRGTDSRLGDAHSFAASKEVIRTRVRLPQQVAMWLDSFNIESRL